jgi:GTP diphosphokinase / guanosine-3',5'-bis(diphosphate) 3'-diphosphatase
MQSYGAFLKIYERDASRHEESLQRLEVELADTFSDALHSPTIESRLKQMHSTWRKMHTYEISLEEIHDLLGLRILVDTVAECYETVEKLRELWPLEWVCVKDYIASPKKNGYQSLHIWLDLPNTPRLEVQIRTRRMHARCLSGAASHRRYKRRRVQGSSPPPKLKAAWPVKAIS